MAGFKGPKMTLTLEAQTPLIHFQHNQSGATLRATEVKPKLDKFLCDKMKKAGLDDAAVKEMRADKEHEAFAYKLQIETVGEHRVVDLEVKVPNPNKPGKLKVDEAHSYTIYYANMGRAESDIIKGVFANIKVSILCFHEKLRELLAENIEEFFLVTNFGTMQGKGFGSFMPVDFTKANKLDVEAIKKECRYLIEKTGAPECYYMEFKEPAGTDFEKKNEACVAMFVEIKQFYSVMKSGMNCSWLKGNNYIRSYIYTYMHEKGMGNEKAWMKQNGIAPCEGNKTQKDKENRYVRAMLGTGETINYLKPSKVKVTIKSAKLERVPSPVFFKVIKNVVFITADDVPEEVLGQEYTFFSDMCREGRKITTLDSFDIHDFMKKYVAHFNGKAREELELLNKAKVVKTYPERSSNK